MALMTCPDCANQYPDDATYCPNCGRPNPARQTGAAGASTGSGQPETPAGTSNTYTAGTGPAAGTGQAAGTGPAGGAYTGGTGGPAGGGYTGGPAGGGYAGGQGNVPPAGGYGGGQAGGGYPGGGGYTGGPAGGGFGGGAPGQVVPNYLVQSILVTVLTCLTCCIPIGAIALYFSTQVNSKLGAGDIPGAMAASKNAKMWCWITLGVALAWVVVTMIFGLLGTIMSAVANQAG